MATAPLEADLEGVDLNAIPQPKSACDIISPVDGSKDVVTKEEALPTSILHVYHNGLNNYRLSPEADSYKDRVWHMFSEIKAQRKQERVWKKEPPQTEDSSLHSLGFFVHKPHISFKHPPRTLRRGQTKADTPLCLFHNSLFWRTWRIQFCEGLDQPGVVDPRGVVHLDRSYANKHEFVQRGADRSSGFVKGYRVRDWRLWGETGKKYHHAVNKQRSQSEKSEKSEKGGSDPGRPLGVSTQVTLSWESPFSKDTRCYHFRYGSLLFLWKGTAVVKTPGFCGFFLRFNHLKLVVRVSGRAQLPQRLEWRQAACWDPPYEPDDMAEVVLATYTSPPAPEKAGTLEIFDYALLWLLRTHFPSAVDGIRVSDGKDELDGCKDSGYVEKEASSLLLETRLYTCIVATAMCMAIAERQKREWVRHILELAAGEAGGAAG